MPFSATWLNFKGLSGLHKPLHQRGRKKKGQSAEIWWEPAGGRIE